MSGYPPLKNVAFTFYVTLIDTANRPDFKAAPTLAAGDFKVSIDGGALTNLASLPTVSPGGGTQVEIALDLDEMNGDMIGIVGIDAAGAEWDDFAVFIQTSEFQVGADLVDAVWDEVISTSAHNGAQSAGKRLRQTVSAVVREDTAQGSGTGTNQIQLDAGASAVDGAYDPSVVVIISGTGEGQSRLILQYDGTTKMATVGRDWKVNPDATSVFQIIANPGREHVNEGLAQGGAASTITLNVLASTDDDAYIDQVVFIRAGTGADQARRVIAYDGTTKIATIDGRNWDTIPDTTSAYVMLPSGMVETTDESIADAVWDEILTGATHNIATSAGRRLRGIQDFQGYESGAIWIDTVNGTAGTIDFENGTVENPVLTMADANTLAASLGINRFVVAPGSTITLAAAQVNQIFSGLGWTLALGGQDISGSSFIGATVSGIAAGTGTLQTFMNCVLNACTHISGTHIFSSGFAGTQTVGEAGDYFFDNCHSAIAGTGTWVFDFGDAIGNTNLNMRHYSGGIQLESMGDTGVDTMSLEGHGQLIEGTCTGGTVAIRGHFTLSGITNLTLSDDARYATDQLLSSDGVNVLQWLGLPVPSLNASTITTSVAASSITQFRGDDWSISLTSLGVITGNTDVWFSVKETPDDTEDNAIVRISKTVGLERLLKAAATAGNGTLVVDDASNGDITMTLVAADTATLVPGSYVFDVQWVDGSGLIKTIAEGTFIVTADVTLATS